MGLSYSTEEGVCESPYGDCPCPGVELPLNKVEHISEVDAVILEEMIKNRPMLFGQTIIKDGITTRCFGGACSCNQQLGAPGPVCPQNLILPTLRGDCPTMSQWPAKVVILKGEIVGFVY